MKNLSIDLETYSSADISKSGVYRYCEAPDFEILLFAYSVDGAPVQSVDLTCGENLPKEIRAALEDPRVTKWAFNASFERICLSRWLGLPSGTYLDPSQWRCSMVWSAYLGLPLSLAGVDAVLKLEKQKLARFPVPDFVWDEYHLDQEINDRGIRLDLSLVENAIRMDTFSRAELSERMQRLTILENPNSVKQLKT